MNDTYMLIIFLKNWEQHIQSNNKDYLVSLHEKLEKLGINSRVVKTGGEVD